jgi:hypothetical protein
LFNIERKGFLGRRRRLVAEEELSSADFRIIAKELGASPLPARKIGLVSATRATRVAFVETRWNGKETRNTASPGDWIVTNLSPQGEILRDKSGHPNTYVIRAATFERLYEPAMGQTEFGSIYLPKGVVEAIHLSGGFEILAPWGQKRQSPDGYLLLYGAEVYGNDKNTFEATYAAVPND